MRIEPVNVTLARGDQQQFMAEPPAVSWHVSPGAGTITPGGCYTAPRLVLITRTLVVTARAANGEAASAAITLSSAPFWMTFLALLWAVLFVMLAIGVFLVWPPPQDEPFVEVYPPSVTLAVAAPSASATPAATPTRNAKNAPTPTPTPAPVAPQNSLQQFSATVWNAADQNVTWTATDGVITPTGLFTAPKTGRRVVVTATRNSDRTVAGAALVTLHTAGLALEPAVARLHVSQSVAFNAVPSSGSAEQLSWMATPSGSGAKLERGALTAPATIPKLTRIVVTVFDTKDNTRQASAIVLLAPEPVGWRAWNRGGSDTPLILLVLLMGALGAFLGASRSFVNFVGNRTFVPSWGLFYLFRPTFGAGLALLVFFGYRIGAVTGLKGSSPADPFAAAFIAGIVGLFADTVLGKLKELITTLFPTQEPRADKMTQDAPSAPAIESAEGSLTARTFEIKGRNFTAGAAVSLNGQNRNAKFSGPQLLTAALDGAKDQVGPVKVVVTNPDKQASAEFSGTIKN